MELLFSRFFEVFFEAFFRVLRKKLFEDIYMQKIGITDQVKSFDEELRLLQSSLEDVEAQVELVEYEKKWGDIAEEIFLEIEEVVDMFQNRPGWYQRVGLFKFIIRSVNIQRKVRKIQVRLRVVSEGKPKLNSQAGPSSSQEAAQITHEDKITQVDDAITAVVSVLDKINAMLSQKLLINRRVIRDMESTRDEFRKLLGILINDFKQIDERTKAWVKEVKDASDLAQHIFESFINKRQHLGKLWIFKVPFFRLKDFKLSKDMEWINVRIPRLYDRKWRYSVGDFEGQQTLASTWKRIISCPIEKLSKIGTLLASFQRLALGDELESIRRDVELMQALLKDIGPMEDLDKRVEVWLKDITEIIDRDAKDLEKFVERAKAEAIFSRHLSIFRKLRDQSTIATKIKQINNKLIDISDRKWTYDIGKIEARKDSYAENPSQQQHVLSTSADAVENHNIRSSRLKLRPSTNLEEKVESIRNELKLMSALFEDVESMEKQDKRLMVWVEEMKDVARDAQKFSDSYAENVEQKGMVSFRRCFFAQYLVLREVDRIKNHIHQLSKRKRIYDVGGIKGRKGPSSAVEIQPEIYEITETSNINDLEGAQPVSLHAGKLGGFTFQNLSIILRNILLLNGNLLADPLEENVESIKRDLSLMDALFEDARGIKIQDRRLNAWVKEMHNVHQDAQSAINYYNEATKSRRWSFFSRLLMECKIGFIMMEIQNASERMLKYDTEHIKRREELATISRSPHHTPPTFVIKQPNITGFSSNVQAVLAQLLTNDKNCLVIPIVGMEGIGKTTLARSIYSNNAVLYHFPCRAWVSASSYCNIEALLKGIEEQVLMGIQEQNRKPIVVADLKEEVLMGLQEQKGKQIVDEPMQMLNEVWEVPNKPKSQKVTQKVKKLTLFTKSQQLRLHNSQFKFSSTNQFLQFFITHFFIKSQKVNPNIHIFNLNFLVQKDKKCTYLVFPNLALVSTRYLLVLDDMRTTEVWDRLLKEFPSTLHGSRIILTTRDSSVPTHANPKSVPHKLQLLSDDDSWALFIQTLTIPDGLLEQSKKMVTRCGGLPWAIVELRKQFLGVESSAWLSVLKNLNNGQKPWLKTLEAIKVLPLYLKRCISYLRRFPAGFEISVRRLIVLWVAEGVVHQRRGDEDPPESVGERYLTELLDRNMVQVTKRKLNGAVKKCRLPHAIRELWSLEAKKAVSPKSYTRKGSKISPQTCKIRHLAHISDQTDVSFDHTDGEITNLSTPLLPVHKHVISFRSFDIREGSQPGEELGGFLDRYISCGYFLSMRVLDLERVFRPELPKSLGELVLLRYLGLRWTYLEELPSFISELLNLQTLDLKHTSISTLPPSIWKMELLRHLYLDESYRCRFVPRPEFYSLTNLQTLWSVFIDEDSPVKFELDRLINLKRLGVTSRIMSSRREAMLSQLEAVADWVQKLTQLQYLRLKSFDKHGQPWFLPLKPLSAHTNLSSIYLLGLIEEKFLVYGLPWALTDLTLSASGLKEDPMRTLKNLPNLRILRLFSKSFIGKHMLCASGGFLQLQVLALWKLEQLEEWKVAKGALPNLIDLEIRSCTKLKMLPDGLRDLSTLQKLKLTDMPKQFTDRITVNQGEDWDKIAHVLHVYIDDVLVDDGEIPLNMELLNSTIHERQKIFLKRLVSAKIQVDSSECPFCGAEPESAVHLFFLCKPIKMIWFAKLSIRTDDFSHLSFPDWINHILTPSLIFGVSPPSKSNFVLFAVILMEKTWLWRNRAISCCLKVEPDTILKETCSAFNDHTKPQLSVNMQGSFCFND
ncbi:unnamed protein product [Camellia sinensis]